MLGVLIITAFLSWLRLATYMAIVAVAILISFHLKHKPTPLERRVALPFGLIFWLLAIACLVSGLHNYIKTVTRYSKRQALVQSGVGTQIVGIMHTSRTSLMRIGLYSRRGGYRSSLRTLPLDRCSKYKLTCHYRFLLGRAFFSFRLSCSLRILRTSSAPLSSFLPLPSAKRPRLASLASSTFFLRTW